MAITGMLDLFAGTGVGVAAKQLGITEYGIEIMPEAVATRDAAGFLTPYNDVWDIDQAQSLQFNTLWASPPCQTFSIAGNGAGRYALQQVLQAIQDRVWETMDGLEQLAAEVTDERTALVLTPLTYVKQYRPDHVVLEQVVPVLPVWEAFKSVLEDEGYSVWTGVLNSEQYGVAQVRARAYLIARRDGKEATPPIPTHSRYYQKSPTRYDHGVKPWISAYQKLSEHMGDDAWGLTHRPHPTLTSHLGVTRSATGTQQIYVKAIESGQFVFKPVDPIESKVAKNGIGSKYAPNTINIGDREGTLLGGYPDGFPFQGGKTVRHLQIGNAVPPPVAKAVLETFK